MNKLKEKIKKIFYSLIKNKLAFITLCFSAFFIVALAVAMVYIAYNPIKRVTYVPATNQPISSGKESIASEEELDISEIEIPEIQIADENSNEDIKNIEEEIREEDSEENKDITIVDSIKNITTKQWNTLSYGIDVSSHNGDIDWQKVAPSGVEFVMIRCGYRGYVTGEIVQDARFDQNIKGASQNNISIGIYFYSTAINEKEAVQEAMWVAQLLSDYEKQGIKIAFPVAYDFEEFYNKEKSRAHNVTKNELTKNTKMFLNYIDNAGYSSMLYASKSAVDYYWDFSEISDYDFWLAHYCQQTNYGGAYSMWQYSCTGKIDGIKGNTDLNISYYRYLNPSEAVECISDEAIVYNGYNENSGEGGQLAKGAIYERRRTLATGWSEIIYNGFTGYVKSECLTPVKFEEYNTNITLSEDTSIYSLPILNNDKIIGNIKKGETVKVTGIYKNKWYIIENDEREQYISIY